MKQIKRSKKRLLKHKSNKSLLEHFNKFVSDGVELHTGRHKKTNIEKLIEKTIDETIISDQRYLSGDTWK